MPYILPSRRNELDGMIDPLGLRLRDVGELNYAMTRLALMLLKRLEFNYSSMSNILGTMQAAAHEFYFRVFRPYENNKLVTNGDLPDYAYFANLPFKDKL